MSGSGGGGGYDYQADAFALIASYALAQQPLDWFDEFSDIPVAISVETDGPGDDLKVELRQGCPVIEVQAKHGASKDKHFTSAMLRLVSGLAKDETLFAVLLVDSTTSSTIRDDLRSDIIRLGQGRSDRLSNITTDIIKLLKDEGISANADHFRRLRIVVHDLDDGAQGRAAATTLLSQVVDASEQASTAWNLLSKEGSRLIANRGRRDLRSLVALLGRHLTLSAKSESHIIVLERYQKWVLETNKEFFVAGLDTTLPIQESWSNLILEGEIRTAPEKDSTLARQISRYHEWERLANPRNGGSPLLAKDALRQFPRMVVIGGPGAGKSTLGRALAAWAAGNNTTVLRVSLRQLGQLLADGSLFDRALLQLALDGSGITEPQGLNTLCSPDFLIADGLDESDPNRILVADSLRAWVNGHPNCHVCVMTRPVGHSPSMLHGFKHLDLLPLNDEAVKEYSLKLIRAKVNDEIRSQDLWRQFTRQVVDEKKKYRFASIAARNPLLLSFLVSLFLDGKSLTGNRSSLFQQIVELIRLSPMNDRPSTITVDSTIANRVADVLANFSIEFPGGILATAVDVLTQDLMKQMALSPLLARQQVELSLRFWEEKRLIERLKLGHLEAFTFVHLNLGEYLAGRFISTLKDEELRAWLARTRRASRWRQPILFACGAGAVNRVVSVLLDLDDPDDPSSTDPLLAASGIAEYERAEIRCVNETVARLQQRLESGIPLVAIEAGIGLCEIASVGPQIVGAAATKLIDSEHEWTRLASVAASLSAGSEYISLGQTKEFLENFRLVQTWSSSSTPAERRISIMPREAYELQKQAVPLAVEKLIVELKSEEAQNYLPRLLEKLNISSGMLEDIWKIFLRHKASDLAGKAFVRLTGGINLGDLFRDHWSRSGHYQALLEVVIEVTDGNLANTESITRADFDFPNLSALLVGMGFWESPVTDIYVLAERQGEPALREVVRGAIGALRLNTSALNEEAKSALTRVKSSSDSELFQIVGKISTEPDWATPIPLNLDFAKLVDALFHPSLPVRFTAAQLLSSGGTGEEGKKLVRQALHDHRGQESTMQIIALLAPELWEPKQAAEILLERLNGPRIRGFGYLYEALTEIAQEFKEIREPIIAALLKGITSPDSDSATAASSAIVTLHLPPDPRVALQLRAAFEERTKRRLWCDRCDISIDGSSCSQCHRIPPNPSANLVKELTRMNAMDAEELLNLCEDKRLNVSGTAAKCLATVVSHDSRKLQELLIGIKEGLASLSSSTVMNILNALLSLPTETLKPATQELLALTDSAIPAIRARVVLSFSSTWADPSIALAEARRALTDPAPAVRNAATRTLRLLRPQV